MLKQGIIWFTLAAGMQETVQTNSENVLTLLITLKYEKRMSFKILTI